MQNLDVTRMSIKGQVVIPGDIRQALGLVTGTKFIVACEGDMVILRKIGRPALEEADRLFSVSREFAKRAGLKKSDVKKAVKRSRTDK
ncbi:MAG: AbrB/MazE/SpoVT family DNA-binding domain-containing protein [Elusimicrobiota bacterium]|nr:AbrB/MazE/SpoVT family DNA-binding domain-containing protein [Elusimicrobiota bacterium]